MYLARGVSKIFVQGAKQTSYTKLTTNNKQRNLSIN